MNSFLEWGLVGVFVVSFLAATVVPIGSETIISAVLYAGYPFWAVIVVATLGNWLGGMLGYYMGYLGKWEWLERYFKIRRQRIADFQSHVHHYGSVLALFCWLPGIGDLLAIGLGFFRTNWRRVMAYMLVGKFIRFVAWAYLTKWVLSGIHP